MTEYVWAVNDYITATSRKIRAFKNLPNGWHFGEGCPPSDTTISQAQELNKSLGLVGFQKTNAFPGIDGAVRVTAYHNKTYLEFTIEANGEVTFLHEEGGEEIEYRENVSLSQATEFAKDLGGKLWASFDSSIQVTTTILESDSRVLPSKPHEMEAESQLLMKNVPLEPVAQSVSISTDITHVPLQSSSGEYLEKMLVKIVNSLIVQAQQVTPVITTS